MHKHIGKIYKNTGQYSLAVVHLKEAIRLNSEDATIHADLGKVYNYTNSTDLAIQSYRRVLNINPNDEMAWLHLGLTYRRKGNNAAAADSYLAVLRINPDNKQVQNNLAVTYFYLKQYKLALKHAKIAKGLGANTARLLRVLRQVWPEGNTTGQQEVS